MSFALDVSRFAKKTKSTLDESVRAIKIELFNGVIRDTRFDTGRLRGNWQTTTGEPAGSEIDRLDPSGALATAEVAQNVTGLGGVDYLANNLPYAEVWETRDGMVLKNMIRIRRIVSDVAGRR